MSGFAADWLALREPADHRARDPGLRGAVAAHFAGARRLVVTDLGSGTGSTLRALADVLPSPQRWRLVDADAGLLAAAPGACAAAPGACAAATGRGTIAIETVVADLAADVGSIVALEADLVTTSAFLDLVSDAWLARWVAASARHARPVYAALSYDGRVRCEPADPLDAEVLAAFDAHQRRDKGLGGALGPAAGARAARRFAEAGFAVATAAADWRLGEGDAALQARLLAGWHAAVAQTGRVGAAALDGWLRRRLDAIGAGRSRVRVGHVDLWACPVGRSASAPRSRSHSRSSPSR